MKSRAYVLEVSTGEEVKSVNEFVKGILDRNGQEVEWMERLEELRVNNRREARYSQEFALWKRRA